MTAVTSLSFSVLGRSSEMNPFPWSARNSIANFHSIRVRTHGSHDFAGVRSSSLSSRALIRCLSAVADAPTVSTTKLKFLKAYKRLIPSIYNSVLQELIVQQHLMRYKKTYCYDAVFALGFVTVYNQLMEGYPSDEDREAIFQAYIKALDEDPEQYRSDAWKLEEWACSQTVGSLFEFPSREGEVEGILKDIADRAGGRGSFSYSRFFAVGLFRLLELSKATDPTSLEKLCAAFNISKRSVDLDLDVYRNTLSKLVQAKELLKEYVDREKKKREERLAVEKADEVIAQCSSEQLVPLASPPIILQNR